jgi:HlyD family secretion protein
MRLIDGSLALAVAGTLLAAAAGCNRSGGAPAAAEADAPSAGAPIRVTVGKPVRKMLTLDTTQPARIEAFEETPLFAKLAAFVKEVHVDIGDQVVSGQSLVTLDIPELVDDVDQREAMLAQAAAEVEQAASNVEAVEAAAETAQAKIAEAQAGITRATGEYERWKAEYARIKQLAESGSVTEKVADETLSQFRAAEASREEAVAAVQSAEAAAREAQANIGKAEADRVAAEARLKVAKSDLARAKTMLGYAEIKAPFDGVVTQRSIDTGHFVQPAGGGAAKPLLTIARIDMVRVFMDIPEMDAARVDVGDQATLLVQALGGKKLEAPVARTSWSLDPANRSLRAEIDVINEASALRPGMYAVGTIQLDRRENALVLPVTSIVRVGAETYCCCVQSGKIDRRKIELGLRSGPEVEVLNGIDEESVVVLANAGSLEQDQPVDVIKPPN